MGLVPPRDAPKASKKSPKPAGEGEPPAPTPAVYEQTSRMHKVMAAVDFEDEFSNRSLKAESRKKGPVELKPEPQREESEGGGHLLRFFRGFIR